MRVIDAHTGLEVHVGQRIPMPLPGVFSTPESSRARMQGLTDYYYELTAIRPGILSASADAIIVENGQKRLYRNLPLQVRWTHPGYFLQHVAFVPS